MGAEALSALVVTTAAGLATGLGGALAFLGGATKGRAIAIGLGFSAGAMLWVAFVELWPASIDPAHPWRAAVAFFVGIAVAAGIDAVVPSPKPQRRSDASRLHRLGIVTAIAIALHNFPEGAATFFATLHDASGGSPTAIAVALHNVPEGIAVALPVYHATGSRARALAYATASGFAEPIGGLVTYAVFGDATGGGPILAAVAGIMVYISLDHLVPHAKRFETKRESLYGLVVGMAMVALTMLAYDAIA